MKLELVGLYFTITTNPQRATVPISCGTCTHGLVKGTVFISNPRDFVWCEIGRKKEPRNAKACSIYRNIWKKL